MAVFGNKGGPGTVGRSWETPCLGVEAKKTLEKRKSGYSDRSFRISLGAWAHNRSEAAGEETAERTSRVSASKTLALATSINKA